MAAGETAHHHAPGAGRMGGDLNTAAAHQHCRRRGALFSHCTGQTLVAGVERGSAMYFVVMTRDLGIGGDVSMCVHARGGERDPRIQKVAVATRWREQNGADSPIVSGCVAMKDFSSSC